MEDELPPCEGEGCHNVYVPGRCIVINNRHLCDDCFWREEYNRLGEFFGSAYKYPFYNDNRGFHR